MIMFRAINIQIQGFQFASCNNIARNGVAKHTCKEVFHRSWGEDSNRWQRLVGSWWAAWGPRQTEPSNPLRHAADMSPLGTHTGEGRKPQFRHAISSQIIRLLNRWWFVPQETDIVQKILMIHWMPWVRVCSSLEIPIDERVLSDHGTDHQWHVWVCGDTRSLLC